MEKSVNHVDVNIKMLSDCMSQQTLALQSLCFLIVKQDTVPLNKHCSVTLISTETLTFYIAGLAFVLVSTCLFVWLRVVKPAARTSQQEVKKELPDAEKLQGKSASQSRKKAGERTESPVHPQADDCPKVRGWQRTRFLLLGIKNQMQQLCAQCWVFQHLQCFECT